MYDIEVLFSCNIDILDRETEEFKVSMGANPDLASLHDELSMLWNTEVKVDPYFYAGRMCSFALVRVSILLESKNRLQIGDAYSALKQLYYVCQKYSVPVTAYASTYGPDLSAVKPVANGLAEVVMFLYRVNMTR